MLFVLEPPFDGWADSSFALHMTQHVVLMTIAPPLLVLGRPWPRLWLVFPLHARRAVGRRLPVGGVPARIARPHAAAARGLAGPDERLAGALARAGAYDAAVTNEWIHVLEHASFLGTSLLWWGSLLEAPPVRARIDHLRRAMWFTAALLRAGRSPSCSGSRRRRSMRRTRRFRTGPAG